MKIWRLRVCNIRHLIRTDCVGVIPSIEVVVNLSVGQEGLIAFLQSKWWKMPKSKIGSKSGTNSSQKIKIIQRAESV